MEKHKVTAENCKKKQRAVLQYCHQWIQPIPGETLKNRSPLLSLVFMIWNVVSCLVLLTSAEAGGSHGII